LKQYTIQYDILTSVLQVPSMTFAEGISVTLFAIGSLTQFFLLCSSVQTLSDAVRFITLHYINYFYLLIFVSNVNDIEEILNYQILFVLFQSSLNLRLYIYHHRNL